MESETPLAHARGLGSAREGAEHWWHERLSSVSTLVLFVWFAVSLLRLPDLGYAAVAEWLREPVNATAMLLLIVSSFWHGKLGLQVFFEDYVHDEGNKTIMLMLLNFAAYAGAGLALFSVLKIALGGGAA
jgi:succinate dehydrogenase / fumarate reductase, membrane anchor subunit